MLAWGVDIAIHCEQCETVFFTSRIFVISITMTYACLFVCRCDVDYFVKKEERAKSSTQRCIYAFYQCAQLVAIIESWYINTVYVYEIPSSSVNKTLLCEKWVLRGKCVTHTLKSERTFSYLFIFLIYFFLWFVALFRTFPPHIHNGVK